MITKPQATRLAAAINLIRPDWMQSSLVTLIGQHRHRPATDVAAALAWLAADPETKSPGRINTPGPWWPTTTQPVKARLETCPVYFSEFAGICGNCRSDHLTGQEPPLDLSETQLAHWKAQK